jgi:hypothetical protein
MVSTPSSRARRHVLRAGSGALAALALCGCGNSGSSNAAPRLHNSIPPQFLAGGTTLTLDLAAYVADRETPSSALTYAVVSGGGSFNGSVYSNTFDTLGTYTVTLRITDTGGKSLDVDVEATVNTANLAVVSAGNDIRLLDTDTNFIRDVAEGDGFAVTHKAALTRGCLVYERAAAFGSDLYLFDANTGSTLPVGNASDKSEQFAGKVDGDRFLFTVTDASSTSLVLHDARARTSTTVATVANEHVRGVQVTASGRLYVELTSGGQGDIYVFDPGTSTLTAVSTDPNDERLRGVLADGGSIWSRVGAGGEADLYYHRTGVGVVEVAAGQTSLASLNKTFRGGNGDSLVVFEVSNGSQSDLYAWNPTNGATSALGTTGDNETFAAFTADEHVVFNADVGGTDNNLLLFDVDLLAVRPFPASGVDDTWLGNLTDGRVVFSKAEASGVHLFLAAYDGTSVSETVVVSTAANDFTLVDVLANDNLIYRNSTTTELVLWRPVGGATSLGVGATFGGETAVAGDFVFMTLNAGQTDVVLWDESVPGTVTVANGPTNETFAAALPEGRILFTRVIDGGTTADLWLFEPTPAETRLTQTTVSHAVRETFAADNR